jgi:hypothetical protein
MASSSFGSTMARREGIHAATATMELPTNVRMVGFTSALILSGQ